MNKYIIIIVLLFYTSFVSAQEEKREKTIFQTSQSWKPTTDIGSDVAVVYGVGGNPSEKRDGRTFEERVQSWRDKGYLTHFMTGIAWGEYQDYFTGKWDGKWHLDEGQVTQQGDTLWHGYMVPYIVPTENYLKYIKEIHIKRVIDAGIDAIYLEEPEFWARAGYSDSFKKEWKNYYGFDWRAQHESAENTYLSNKLKYHLYYRALDECFAYAKEYGKSKGMDVKCYVPTHSLVNYSQWQIVSPEASLASLNCVDGYIAQVWTGTSREKNYYDGDLKERVFETAFLEYGSMESMTEPTGRKMFFLTDPIEDLPRDWEDYKRNYQATFIAQLLYPKNNNYEVMPWPDRIYEGLYKTSINSDTLERIPQFYSTQVQVMINALNYIPVSNNKINGNNDIKVLMSNSLMFQRSPNVIDGYDDPQLSNFYGLTMPLLKRGIPVQTMHIENVMYPQSWNDAKLLLMTYSNMKPLDEKYHSNIAEWVKNGGNLIYCGRDDDPFQNVKEWWNENGNNFKAPSEHLFKLMKIKYSPKKNIYKYGKGCIYIIRKDPKEFVLQKTMDQELINAVKLLYENKNDKLIFKNNFILDRGPYSVISVIDENEDDTPYVANGQYIDLFDPQLSIITEKIINPGEQAFLYDLNKIENKEKPQVLASGGRIYDDKFVKNRYTFKMKSPINTVVNMQILLPDAPKSIALFNYDSMVPVKNVKWNETTKTLFISTQSIMDDVSVDINL